MKLVVDMPNGQRWVFTGEYLKSWKWRRHTLEDLVNRGGIPRAEAK